MNYNEKQQLEALGFSPVLFKNLEHAKLELALGNNIVLLFTSEEAAEAVRTQLVLPFPVGDTDKGHVYIRVIDGTSAEDMRLFSYLRHKYDLAHGGDHA